MEDSSSAHALLCHCYYSKWEFVKAVAEGERAVALDPGDISALNAYARSLTGVSRAEEAIPIFQKAIRLNPFGPSFSYRNFGVALRNVGRFEEAVSAYTKAIQIAPDDMMAHLGLTGVYIMLGHWKEARAEAAEVLRINPKFSVDSFKTFTYCKEGIAPVIEATVKVRVGELEELTVAEGDGPVNALDTALRTALSVFYPVVKGVKLVDYKVRILNPKAGTAALTRVLILFRYNGYEWGTVGVSGNIIEASWRALVDSFELYALRGPEKVENHAQRINA